MARTSNNGGKTFPLTPHAIDMLASIAKEPLPTQEINPGVVDRLTRDEKPFAEIFQQPSRYKTHKGKNIPWLRATAAGREELKRLGR